MEIFKKVEESSAKKELPEFRVGDVVDVFVRFKEGEKDRVQRFSGTVIKIKGGRGIRSTFTVRRIVQGEGVERVFPFHSPAVDNVVVTRPGKVRRAKLYFLRDRVGKATKVKERRDERRPAASPKSRSKKASAPAPAKVEA